MGEEAAEYFLDGLDEFLLYKGNQTSNIVGTKIYVVGGCEDGTDNSINIKIFDRSTREWLITTVLGVKPTPCKLHSAVPVNGDRILVLKSNTATDDCFWLLEVDTRFVKEQKKILGTEVVAWSRGVQGTGPKPVVISGPSGVGKGTLISKLMKEFPSTFGFSVSHTTRAPREKEVHGVHYYFTERSKMENDIREGKFLESASVHGNLYGTSIEAVEAVTDSGKRCILDIDVQGARSVRASSLEAVFIFICPPSFEELEKRLRARGTETEEQVQKRLRNARAELDQGKSPDLFDHILVNDDLGRCYEELKKILSLDADADAVAYPTMKDVRITNFHAVSARDQKILIHCAAEKGMTPTIYELDASSLEGGAPGRTRGLHLHPMNLPADVLSGIDMD